MQLSLLLAALAGTVLGAPSGCPFGKLFERGQLSEEDAAKYLAARAEGESAIHAQMELATTEKTKRAEHAAQEKFYKRQLEARQLNLGGGMSDLANRAFTRLAKLTRLFLLRSAWRRASAIDGRTLWTGNPDSSSYGSQGNPG